MASSELTLYYDIREQAGWTAIFSRLLSGYGTKRLAKIMPDGELQFTVGATERGVRSSLNRTIKSLAHECGFVVLDRHSTSGSRKGPGEYPAVRIGKDATAMLRLLSLVEGAALQEVMRDDA